jgi:hypothetical protein
VHGATLPRGEQCLRRTVPAVDQYEEVREMAGSVTALQRRSAREHHAGFHGTPCSPVIRPADAPRAKIAMVNASLAFQSNLTMIMLTLLSSLILPYALMLITPGPNLLVLLRTVLKPSWRRIISVAAGIACRATSAYTFGGLRRFDFGQDREHRIAGNRPARRHPEMTVVELRDTAQRVMRYWRLSSSSDRLGVDVKCVAGSQETPGATKASSGSKS